MSTYDLTLKSADGTDRVNVTAGSLSMVANNSKILDIEDGSVNIGPSADAGQALANNVRLGSSGVYVYGASNDGYVHVRGDDGIDLVVADANVATFAGTTTIGDTSGKHVKIDSNAISIKTDANTTVLSASAAGLDMSGSINASGGTIGGFDISTAKLQSAISKCHKS